MRVSFALTLHDLVFQNLHTFYLECDSYSKEHLPDSFFEAFPKLECLLLRVEYLDALPLSIQNLDRLRSLTIVGRLIQDLSLISQLKNLEMLSLDFPVVLGLLLDLRQVRHLRMLDLRGCTDIKILVNVFSGLSKLEELYIPIECWISDEETEELSPAHSVLSKLSLLKRLEAYFGDSSYIPDESFCQNLLGYNISVGGDYVHQKEYLAKRSVQLSNESIEGGMKTLVERSDEVILQEVKGLQKFFSHRRGAFTDLKWLTITECLDAEHLIRIPFQNRQLAASSLSKLSALEIGNSGFKYLFCASTARCLRELENLRIYDCEMMEEIVRNEGEIEEDIEFFKLRYLELTSLPELRSFCSKKSNTWSTKTDQTTTIPVQSLFDGTVVFPALETLSIRNLDNVREIWEKQRHKEKSFCNLRYFSVSDCNQLEIVVPFAMLQRLHNLTELSISNCDSVISEVEDPYCGETTAALVLLPGLTKLNLEALPKLSQTCLNSREFSDKITLCPNLLSLFISSCGGLRNVMAPSVARYLVYLEELNIESCEKIKEIIGTVGEGMEDNIVFPTLKILQLKKLATLSSFWCYRSTEPNIDQSHSIFCHKVVFPALEIFDVSHLDNVVEIWERQCHIEESFCQLNIIQVEECHKLENVIPYAMFQRLRNLEQLSISNCHSLISEVQVPSGGESEKQQVILPGLKKLYLKDLPKLKETVLNSWEISSNNIFYPNLMSLVIVECNNLRNVFLPSVVNYLDFLEELEIRDCSMMNEIIVAVGGHSGEEIHVDNIEFPTLKILRFERLPMMKSFWGYGCVEPNLDQQQSYQTLKVSFPSLKEFWYEDVKINLEEINLGRNSTSDLRVYNSSQSPTFVPPNLLLSSRNFEFLILENCWFHELDLFSLLGNSSWNNNPYGAISFRRLQMLEVNSCRLSTIFTYSVAKTLQQLRTLGVRSCGSIQEIVTDERRNDTCEEISFPKLTDVSLADLPKLKSFCHGANCSFKMPLLQNIHIKRCPQMLSFTPRQISTPDQVRVSMIPYPSLRGEQEYYVEDYTTDINNYIWQIMKTQANEE